MKTRYLTLLATGLLTIGIPGASDSIAASNIEHSISGGKAIKISRIAQINDDTQQRITIDGIAAINKIIDTDIQADQTAAEIREIAA